MHWSWQDFEALPLSVLSVLEEELIAEQKHAAQDSINVDAFDDF